MWQTYKKTILKIVLYTFWSIAFVYFFYQLYVFISIKNDFERNKKQIESYNASLKYQIDSLNSLITELKTNNFLIEKFAREKLGMAKEGEVIFKFKYEENK